MAENDKAKGKKQVPLRLSASLYDELARWAEDDFRSINGQIEYLLTECVKKRKKAAPKRAVNYPPGEAPELNEPFIFEFPDGHTEKFENVKVFLNQLVSDGTVTYDGEKDGETGNVKD